MADLKDFLPTQIPSQIFLEVERFDRHGRWGRSPLVSLATLDAVVLGQGSGDWPRLAAALASQGLVDDLAVPAITPLWWFGRLTVNTDRHTGNLSFQPAPPQEAGGEGAGATAAASPLPGGEVPPHAFTPALPPPAERHVWRTACSAAIGFWTAAASDSRISEAFRSTAANAQTLARLADRV